jgi:hypothetical protein
MDRGDYMTRFQLLALTLFAAVFSTTGAVQAQSTPNAPMGEIKQRSLDTGVRSNASMTRSSVVYADLVHTPGASWTRLYFSDVHLDRGSRLRVTSLFDGEVQELDAEVMAMWRNSTAYFNGDTVLVELIAAPRSRDNRVVMDRIGVELTIGSPELGLCGICGSDTRVPSDEDWSGRLAPGGCSAGVFNSNSCMVSAGHCMSGNSVVQFRVPNSTGNCFTQNPPLADQFPITDEILQNTGVGGDWAVMTTGTNNLGQTIYQRYGEYRPIASSPANVGAAVDVWGFGQSQTCQLTYTQQHSTGTISQRTTTYYAHSADTTSGNSGSAFLHNDQIIGVVTHCQFNCPNISNRIDTPAFAAAIAELCPDPTPSNNACQQSLVVPVGTTAFSNVGATTTGPDEGGICDQFGETDLEADVWFGHLATCTGDLTISLCGSSFATRLAVYPFQCPTSPGTVIACDTTGCPSSTRSEVTISVTQGQAFRIRVGGRFGATGDGLITITCEESQPLCPEDLNADGVVNVSDLLILLGAWGDCSGCDEDLNGDGVVNVSDLLILLGQWGPCE